MHTHKRKGGKSPSGLTPFYLELLPLDKPNSSGSLGPPSGVGAPHHPSWLLGWSQPTVPTLLLITTAIPGTWTPACLKWGEHLANSSRMRNSFIWGTDKIQKCFLSYQLLPKLEVDDLETKSSLNISYSELLFYIIIVWTCARSVNKALFA